MMPLYPPGLRAALFGSLPAALIACVAAGLAGCAATRESNGLPAAGSMAEPAPAPHGSTWSPADRPASTAHAVADLRPAGLSEDLSEWPNRVSFRNSDDWLWRHHTDIRVMRPRVAVLNFANDVDMDAVRRHTEALIRATAEATRYHGFENPGAPAFVQYEVVAWVDLRDTAGPHAGAHETSTRFPRKADPQPGEALCDYAAFFTNEFASHLGFVDPRLLPERRTLPDAGGDQRFLNLAELINAGFVHELWFYAIHDGDPWPGFESLELKQFYDETGRPIPGRYGHSGNGADDTLPWVGRSFRICFFNPHRGVGCAMENFGHTLEATAGSGSIPYFTRYFREFADLDLDRRYGAPFDGLYATDPQLADSVKYPTATSMSVTIGGQVHRLDPYVAIGGNVHFPPGARHHYDLDSPFTVMSRIEAYRRITADAGGPAAEARPFHIRRIECVGDLAPDCMGNWTIFWRQCMPGLDNPCFDDEGRPMKNWWVFLFY